jgi:hypothetical protein
MNQDQIDAYNQEQQDLAKEQALIDLQKNNTNEIVQTVATSGVAVTKTIEDAINKLINFQASNTTVTVANPTEAIETVHTPDVQEVVKALKDLQATITNEKPDDSGVIAAINELNNSIKSFIVEIPKPIETVTVKNQVDYSKELKDLKTSIDKIELKPIINVPDTPDDYTAIIDELSKVVSAVKEITFPETKLDLTPLIQSTDSVQKAINNLKFPIPNYVLPFKDSTGKATQANLTDGSLSTVSKVYTERYDTSNSPIIYTGFAVIGTPDDSTGWTITKYDVTTSSSMSGKIATDVTWNNRASGTYA